ncbi:hypothetical protein NFI96_020818, partial [Prochilodus magdalenae]
TQVSPSELQDVFQETSSNIFQINANVVTLEKSLQSLGTSRDTAELRQSLSDTAVLLECLSTSVSLLDSEQPTKQNYPASNVLWAASCGQRPVGSIPWAASCGQGPVGSVLWAVSCGQRLVGSVLWAASCGLRPVGCVLWAAFCGQRFVGSVLWAVSCGQCPLGSIRHSTQQQTNKVITSTSQLIKQLSDIISGSSRQDRLRLTRLKTELSESVQRYGDLQKKIADRSRALLPPAQNDRKQSPQTPFTELCEEGALFGAAESVEGEGQQAFLSEISEEDVEVLRQREEALLQIERDMLDVNQIMKDLASMVHEQGDTIDSIEDYIQTTGSHVESANQELAKASHYQ